MFKSDNDRLKDAIAKLNLLEENLYSVILYGSRVRGDAAKKSDINLMIVLQESTPHAHKVISEVVGKYKEIRPFILGRSGLERSERMFGLKFLSIKRNYKVLQGEDVLKDFILDDDLRKILVEQSLRNLRLRFIHEYVMKGGNVRKFNRYLKRMVPQFFTNLSDVLRYEKIEVPHDYIDRISVFEKYYEVDCGFLRHLLELKTCGRNLNRENVDNIYSNLLSLLNLAILKLD